MTEVVKVKKEEVEGSIAHSRLEDVESQDFVIVESVMTLSVLTFFNP